MKNMEKQAPEANGPPPRTYPGDVRPRRHHGVTVLAVLSLLLLYFHSTLSGLGHEKLSTVESVQKCAIDNLHQDLSFLDQAEPITADEFVDRRDRLAQALAASHVDAFVVEPGYTFKYYGNVSQPEWENWEQEERATLLVILPETSSVTGAVRARTAFLCPHFEEGRLRMLPIPSRDDAELEIVVWEEHWNPFTTLLESHLFTGPGAAAPTLMVDEEMRDFISRGLATAGFRTVGLDKGAELVRQRKSAAEVALVRAVNTGTVEAVRAMRPCLVPGLTEDEVMGVLDGALLSVGFGLFFDIVLFEEHGALPHGGFVTGGKRLTHETMVVIDVGAHYLGYSSDVCRSFFIDPPPGWAPADPALHAEKLHVWDVVLDAQTAAAEAFRPNGTAASVDIAARTVIEDAGYGPAFTHRVGHGIGIKAHESPYLNKWNTKDLLQPGMAFTNEPGIYLENRFGVRHEDIYLVTEDGEAELLSGRRARGPYDP